MLCTAASLRLTRGLQLDLEIALSSVPAKVQPHELLQPGRRCVETSDNVIKDDFTSTPDSCIWDFSPIRLGAAKTARESAKSRGRASHSCAAPARSDVRSAPE